jgi:hypothetical protein
MRVVGIEEGEGGKAMVIATRVAGKQMATVMTRAIVTKTKEEVRKKGMVRAARAIAIARNAAMASNNDDNHGDGVDSNQCQ